jgi:pimeloyl-ACP methyl ester carboxylesterase
MPGAHSRTGYEPIGDLQMYYEIHGRGRPLVLLHGAYLTIDLMGPILPELAKTREVIAVELQGHGHTADVDRPLTYEQMADDTEALAEPGRLSQAGREADATGHDLIRLERTGHRLDLPRPP